mmetsp:Transcript_60315/g.155378  ORF Transcript_60315/g.155378 Transcript_60315/m.155378 type:complete len:721 (+) Transcript_60315:26-2188(+)
MGGEEMQGKDPSGALLMAWMPGSVCAAVLALTVALFMAHPAKEGQGHESLHALATPNVGFMDPSWTQDDQWPMLVAATLFMLQLGGSLISLHVMNRMPHLADNWTPRFKRSLKVHILITTMGSISYIRDAFATKHLIAERPGMGQHLVLRNVNWLIGTPLQWLIFGQVCTRLNPSDMTHIFLSCISLQVFGILMHFVPNTSLMYICFAVATGSFLQMFRLIFALPLTKEMQTTAHLTRQICFAVWSLYPVLNILRWLGTLDDWTEQVLCFCFIDSFAKMFTFSSIVLARVTLTLSSFNGALQIVLASHDLVLVVNEQFQLLDCPQPVLIISHYFDKVAARTCLGDLCSSQEDFERLKEVATLADRSTLGAPSPMCQVSFRARRDMDMIASCFVSKCVNGRRVISLNMTEVENEGNCEASASHGQKNPIALPSDLRMRLEIALHHCSEFMFLNLQQHDALKDVFVRDEATCALCIWDNSEGCADVVLASQRAQMLHLPNRDLPQPISGVLRDSDVKLIQRVLQVERPVAMQQAGTQLETGCEVTVTVFPVQKKKECSDGSTYFFIVCFQLMESHSSHISQGVEQSCFFWYFVGDQLVCIKSEQGDLIGQPVYVRVPSENGKEEVWCAFFRVPPTGPSLCSLSGPAAPADARAKERLASACVVPAEIGGKIQRFDDLWNLDAKGARELLESKRFDMQVNPRASLPLELQPLLCAFHQTHHSD